MASACVAAAAAPIASAAPGAMPAPGAGGAASPLPSMRCRFASAAPSSDGAGIRFAPVTSRDKLNTGLRTLSELTCRACKVCCQVCADQRQLKVCMQWRKAALLISTFAPVSFDHTCSSEARVPASMRSRSCCAALLFAEAPPATPTPGGPGAGLAGARSGRARGPGSRITGPRLQCMSAV